MSATPPSDRTRVKRLPERGKYDKEIIHSILDEGLVCHVGVAVEDQPFVIPMNYARSGDKLIVHGSRGSRLMSALKNGAEVCVVVTHIDALVLARSAFHHSVNYRSVVIFGKANVIEDDDTKIAIFKEFFEHVLPGRWEDVRKPNNKELAQTELIEISLDEASAKIRTGPPADDDEDYDLPVWAGLVPIELNTQPAEDDPKLKAGIEKPGYLEPRSRKRDK
jgi:nitroimidazol reductase NimA-like FMN-containing flavoprotein (pyridoxamine 5'-phosphate oxidase superfamily)